MTRRGRRRHAVVPALGSWLALALLLAPAAAADAAASERWTIDDLVTAENASGWDLSRDGRRAVWVKSTVAKVEDQEQRVANLWLSSLVEGGEGELGGDNGDASLGAVALTRGQDRHGSPRFSPDGRHVAFVSDRDLPGNGGDDLADSQIWVIPVGGGEAYPVTRFDRSPRGFGWVDDETLVVAAEESPTAWERERKKKKDTTVVVVDAEHQPPVRLFRVGLDGKTRRLTHNDDWISALEVAPDGSRAVVTAEQDLSYEFDQRVPPVTYLVDLKSGLMTALELTEDDRGTPRRLLPSRVRWAVDGAGFYFADDYTRHSVYRNATVRRLHYYDLAAGHSQRIPLDWPRGLGGDFAPIAGGFVALLADGVHLRPALYRRQGDAWQRRELTGTHAASLDGLAVAADGATVVYETSTATRPPQFWRARMEGAELVAERRLTGLNPGFDDKPTGKVEVLRWIGALDEEVEGLLHYPLDWPEGGDTPERRPLILDIHGGPAGADRDQWSQNWSTPGILWRQQGAFVLQVNYHGSAAYGLDWVESIEKRYYELEIPDLEAGVDHVIAQGLADPQRLGTSGWSNGGILTAELITRTDRYKAASVGAADVEWASDWANVDFGAAFDNYYFGAPPWEIPQVYLDKSPFYRLTEVTTPTIVYTGTEDRNVPPHQSWSLFRALQQIGKTETRLVLFPGEPHGLRRIPHQRRKLEEDLAWFDRHLFGEAEGETETEDETEALLPGSPLAALMERHGAARRGPALGEQHRGKVVPETVVFAGLEVGRFEVTQAQWAEFDRGYEPTPGQENLPVTGMTFERARDYAAWLAKATGRAFRLPTEDEAGKLAGKAGDGGNTLDRWAGYTPNPEDREALLRLLDRLAPTSLLLPVGSLPGARDGDDGPMVYDLDGNAAEWAVAEDGAGTASGPSADRTTDPRSEAEPLPELVGLRVVISG